MVIKGEIAHKQFLLFSQCFPQLYIFGASKCGIVRLWVKAPNKPGTCRLFSINRLDRIIKISRFFFYFGYFFVYLSSLPVAHLTDAPRRWLVVTGDSARIQDETTENSAWFFDLLCV